MIGAENGDSGRAGGSDILIGPGASSVGLSTQAQVAIQASEQARYASHGIVKANARQPIALVDEHPRSKPRGNRPARLDDTLRRTLAEMIRAFIAIKLSAELEEMLTRTGRDLATRIPPATVRWAKPAAMHLTLQFLGDTPAASLDAITRAIEAATLNVPPLTMTTGGLGCFPNLRRPRVVWITVVEPSGHLLQLKDALARELAPLGFKPERRPFAPHLTLGRVHKRAGREDVRRLGHVVESAALTDVGRMTAQAVHLIRSDLRPSGPIYSVLARLPFRGVQQTP